MSEGGSVETGQPLSPDLTPLPLRGTGTFPRTPPLSQSSEAITHHGGLEYPWWDGPRLGAPAGGCCCGPTVDPACYPSCSEGPKLPGGAHCHPGAGATEAGAMAKPWTVGGPAAPGGGIGWEPGAGLAVAAAAVGASAGSAAAGPASLRTSAAPCGRLAWPAKSCCLWYSSCPGRRRLSPGGRRPQRHTPCPLLCLLTSPASHSGDPHTKPQPCAWLPLFSLPPSPVPPTRSSGCPHGFTAVDKWT